MSFLSFCIFILSIIIAIIPIMFNIGDIQSKISIGNLLKGNNSQNLNNIENDNLSNELRKKYKILLSDIINYQNDISYLVSERKLLEKINELKIETEKFQEIENKYKTPKIITNFTDKEINEIKGLINDYLK